MKVKFKKLSDIASIPKKSHITDAGFDLVATSMSISTGEINYIEYGTSLAIEIPEGHVGLIFPRSSLSKYDLELCNSVGVIDPKYLGEIKFRFNKTIDVEPKVYSVGDRIGQLIIIPYPEIEFEEVDDLNESERGNNGFGSTGR